MVPAPDQRRIVTVGDVVACWSGLNVGRLGIGLDTVRFGGVDAGARPG
ncbi:hypothetical protein [Halalkalicoccus salilacus]